MTKAAVSAAKAETSLSDYPVGIADPDYRHLTGPTGDPYDIKARTAARATAPSLGENRPGGPHALQLAPSPVAEELQQLLLEGKRDRILEEVGKEPKAKSLAAVTFAKDNGQPVLLAALLRLAPVRNQLANRLQTFVPDAIRLLLDDPELSGPEAGDALRQLLDTLPGFGPSAKEALGERWRAAHACLDPDGVARLAKIADLAGLASALTALDPLAALRNQTASVEQIVRWIDKTDSDSTRALREAVPDFVREVIAERPDSDPMPAAADTVLTLLHDRRYGDAQALLKLLHAAGVPLPTTKFLHAINEAVKARSLDKAEVVPLLSAALGADLVKDIDEPLASGEPGESSGTTVLHLLVKDGALDLVQAVVESGARIDADVVQRCTSDRAVQPLRALYLAPRPDSVKVIKEALRATPQAWGDIVDTLLHPSDDRGDELLEKRASMLTDLLLAPPAGLQASLTEAGDGGVPRHAELLRFASRVGSHYQDAAAMLKMRLASCLGAVEHEKAGAWAFDQALKERAWQEVTAFADANTNVASARQLAARAIAEGAAEADVAALLVNVQRKHGNRNPLVRLFLFLRYGWDAWSKQPVKLAEGHSTIVELLKKRRLDLASLLRLPAAQ